MKHKYPMKLVSLLLSASLLLGGCSASVDYGQEGVSSNSEFADSISEEISTTDESPENNVDEPASSPLASGLPEYNGSPYVTVEDGMPDFSEADLQSTAGWESYSDLDALGRVGTAEACVGLETMPTGERGDISSVKPTGWDQEYYDFVDGEALYNRAHLIAWQLTGQDANEKNLMTGTRTMNVEAMLPFENRIADYIETTGNHVLYRVTPCFVGSELVARGVQMEAMSVEDGGQGISFNIYAFNVEPGVAIDYRTGASEADDTTMGSTAARPSESEKVTDYVLNTNSMRVHMPDCPSVSDMASNNRQDVSSTLSELTAQGYEPCKSCMP